MAEDSRPWAGTVTGDAGPYSSDNWGDIWNSMFSSDRTVEAPLRGRANELEVTGVATPVAVDTGEALVDGTWYENTVAVNVAVPSPAGAVRIDRIALEKDWATQTVRIVRVAGIEGGAAAALTQVDGVTWQVSLAQVSITVPGVITVTDEREFIELPVAVTFDDTVGNPANFADAAADGTDEVAARLDHIHSGRGTRFVYEERGGDPANIANTGQLYTKDDGSGNTELYYIDESGNVQNLSAGGLTKITETEVTGAAVANIDWTSISGAFTSLFVTGRIRPANDNVDLYMRFNNDAGGNYDYNVISGSGTGLNEQNNEGANQIELTRGQLGNDADYATSLMLLIPHYAETTLYKAGDGLLAGHSTAAVPTVLDNKLGYRWLNTGAINRITFLMSGGNVDIGSYLVLYGIG